MRFLTEEFLGVVYYVVWRGVEVPEIGWGSDFIRVYPEAVKSGLIKTGMPVRVTDYRPKGLFLLPAQDGARRILDKSDKQPGWRESYGLIDKVYQHKGLYTQGLGQRFFEQIDPEVNLFFRYVE